MPTISNDPIALTEGALRRFSSTATRAPDSAPKPPRASLELAEPVGLPATDEPAARYESAPAWSKAPWSTAPRTTAGAPPWVSIGGRGRAAAPSASSSRETLTAEDKPTLASRLLSRQRAHGPDLLDLLERRWCGAPTAAPEDASALGGVRALDRASTRARAPALVALLRHGEKPTEGRHLDERGWARSALLPSYLANEAGLLRDAAEVVIFTQLPEDALQSCRAYETIQGLFPYILMGPKPRPIHQHAFARKEEISKIADWIESGYCAGAAVVVCWEHKQLPLLARRLGVPARDWSDDVFDRTWVITYAQPDAKPRLREYDQHLLAGDA